LDITNYCACIAEARALLGLRPRDTWRGRSPRAPHG
jgi:hypothetical protein